MKKCISLFLCFCLLFSFGAAAFAIPLSSGDDALRGEFKGANGDGLDYRYFAPALKEGVKYPLVIWLHGVASGDYPGDQVDSYEFCRWASDEFQARSADGGMYLLCPRCAGGWDLTTPATLKRCVDSFIAARKDSVDTNRIYIAGFSVGATMVLKVTSSYPDFFAAAIPICAVIQDGTQLSAISKMAVWLFANDQDGFVSANTAATRNSFNALKNNAPEKSRIRFTHVSKAVTSSGGSVSNQHYMWRAFTNDLFMDDGSPYAYATTEDGTGATVQFRYPDGVISWLTRQTKETQKPAAARKSFFQQIAEFFRKIAAFFSKLFQ